VAVAVTGNAVYEEEIRENSGKRRCC